MTQDEYEVGSLENAEKFAIIRMARKAGIAHAAGIYMEHLERFAALVAAQASADEREACAKVCDVEIVGDEYTTALINSYADTIRARSKK